MNHDATHEAALARILAGDPQETSELLRCTRCRDELERAREAAVRARAALELERSVVQEARRSASDADRQNLRNLLEHGRRLEQRRRTLRRTFAVVLACAAGVLAWLTLPRAVPTAPARHEEVLLGGALGCSVELSEGRYDVFTWDAIDAPAVDYRLRLRYSEDGLAGAEILSRTLEAPRWQPTPEEESALPEELIMEVEAYGVQGELLGQGWRSVSRR